MSHPEHTTNQPFGMCETIEHSTIPAVVSGTYYDGDITISDVSYCKECATIMLKSRMYTISPKMHERLEKA